MKRARPKNKRAEIKKRKIEEEIRRTEKHRDTETLSNKKTKKKKQKGKNRKAWITVFSIVVFIVFVVMGFGFFDGDDILAPVEDGKINVLLLGVDEDGLRTDTIMVAAYDVNAAKVNLLSIPRDTKVLIENRHMTRKINEIHAISSKKKRGEIIGAEGMAEVVSQLTGIPINYYVEFSFSAIDNLFDILGPVEFNVPDVEGEGRGMNYDDPVQNLQIHLKPGLQKLSGNQIQQFLRYRKSNFGVGTGSDEDRVDRQQELFKAVIDQKVNLGILLKVPAIFSQISKDIRTNIQTSDITKYIRHVAKLSGEGVTSYKLPGESKHLSGGWYFVTNVEETANMSRDIFGYDVTPTDKVNLSDDHSQKVLRAGNKNKQPASTPITPVEDVPATTSSPEPVVTTPPPTNTPAPTKKPKETPTNTPAPTKKPTETKTPLEEIEDDAIILD